MSQHRPHAAIPPPPGNLFRTHPDIIHPQKHLLLHAQDTKHTKRTHLETGAKDVNPWRPRNAPFTGNALLFIPPRPPTTPPGPLVRPPTEKAALRLALLVRAAAATREYIAVDAISSRVSTRAVSLAFLFALFFLSRKKIKSYTSLSGKTASGGNEGPGAFAPD